MRVARFVAVRNRVVTLSELRELGVSSSTASRWVARGRLRREHHGVYVYGGGELSQDGWLYAAQRAIGDDAAVAHVSAALHLGFWPYSRPGRAEIVVPRRVRSRRRIRVHEVAELPADAVMLVRGVRVTTPARTMIHLAGSLHSDRAFRRTVHEAQAREILHFAEFAREVQRAPECVPGKARLLVELAAGPTRTRSGFEEWVLDLLRGGDFPCYETNARIPGMPAWIEVDVFFPEARLVVEIDGDRWHKTPWRQEQDAYKRALIKNAGYHVLVLTEDDKDHAEATIREKLLELG
ncbi:MAG TPA: AbiEi antitoxin N-terminal domain-containing protein [Solirubrobacteraceae bacterium]|nr:AbiEi antitoxin N-terminal domain-containing protein [Solirubrobacteraceae bacterium]